MVLGGVFVFGLGILWVRGKVTFLVRLRFPIFRHKPTLFSIGKFSLMMLLGGIWATSTAKCIAFENVVSTASKYYVDDAEPALSNAAVWVHCSKKRSVFLPHSMTSAWESTDRERFRRGQTDRANRTNCRSRLGSFEPPPFCQNAAPGSRIQTCCRYRSIR